MPRLLVRRGDSAGQDHALGGPCVVGRHPSADFVVDDPLVSRRHVRVSLEEGRWVVQDLGSTNGTTLNGKPVKQAPLADGDVIGVGSTELKFVQKDMLETLASGRPPGPPAPVPRRRRGR